ncbi:glycosyltransferase [Xanthovirga aplysinae]|uniref:glycosyltransferase n=1 Tax=Xanthovirga aplysinae TaxID=2529853 RepID=UPI0012BBF651|nr:glycosyltransferase [Xanthovirga aplysinae]MTI32539.1 glycosyltransferase [Xanthovirga aplysinae]
MRKYSVIIPVYNRPDEIDELLESLCHQTYTHFEVLVVEDGSSEKCDHLIPKYEKQLDLQYFYKENTGQGFSRNFGFERAKGDYFVVFDSDCLIPKHYFDTVDKFLDQYPFDAFGGPDRAHKNFTSLQKAMSYAMTSFFTTGGIRGKKKGVGNFQPRSFNMAVSRKVFQKTGGFRLRDMGEDIEWSMRINQAGFKVGLISGAYVYHKRRTNLKAFFKQIFSFGQTRIRRKKYMPGGIKVVHLLPAFFVLALLFYFLMPLLSIPLFKLGTLLLIFYCLAILLDATFQWKSLKIGVLSLVTSFVQLTAYGLGFLYEMFFGLKEDS